MARRVWRAAAAVVLGGMLGGCAALEGIYLPVDNAALQGPPPAAPDTRCDAPAGPDAPPPPYTLMALKDCTSPNSLIVFAFSGGGTRSAAFGYGVLGAAHAVTIPDGKGGHPLDSDIDIVSGVSGGSFTAAAYASKRGALFPAPGAPDYYRDRFLTHDFMADLFAIYLEPWHWQWMFPGYGTNDEMAKLYAQVDFSSPSDKLFDRTFGDLAKKGRPLLVVQATDYGNEQPFTFTQSDFDLICSDVDSYPVANAIAASSAFPVLFSPIQLTNHHFGASGGFCAGHRPKWIDHVLSRPEPVDLSRLYERARVAEGYMRPRTGAGGAAVSLPRHVFLQDGGVADNVALRGLTNIVIQHFGTQDSGEGAWSEAERSAACRVGLGQVRRVLIVAVDGEAQPDNQVSSLPYLSDVGLILSVSTSAAIDANGLETMFATDALTKSIALRLKGLTCDGAAGEHDVASYFTRVSFRDLDEATVLDAAACGRSVGASCTLGDVARSGTSLDFSGGEVDALIRAGRSAFLCNRKIGQFLKDADAAVGARADLACEHAAPPAGG